MHRGASRGGAGRTVAAILPALLLLAACAVPDRDVVAQQSGRLDDLQVRLLRLERALDEVRRSPPAAAPSPTDPELSRRLADLGQRVEALEGQVRTLSGSVDEVRRGATATPAASPRLPALEAEVAELTRRLEALEARPVATPAPVPTPVPTPAPAPATPATPAAQTPAPSQQALYDSAYGLYKQGKYDEARDGFRQYIDRFPDTPLTDNAYFWIGETYYDQREYEQAILEYDKVVQKFPQGDKVPGALLKQAFAFDAIGDPVDARILLKKILREHPSSEQAAIAKKKLEILGE